jgi:hypothetical protein
MKLNVDDFKRLKEWLKGVEPTNEDLANFVNLRIKEWLDVAPTVYAQEKAWGWAKRKRVHDIFKAKLVCIEEIK